MTKLTITRPDDWHVHLRDGDVLKDTVRDTSRYMGRAIIMPNLMPPVTTTELAQAYQQRILEAKPTPTLNIKEALIAMQEVGMLLLVHGEVTTNEIDIFDREEHFLKTVLAPLAAEYPDLKIVLEHITTKNAADFVNNAGPNVAATITVHHLLYNRNHMLVGGIKPHFYCLPILKRNIHQQALIESATSGSNKFFLGTDSAPHTQESKESGCGCAGSYTAFAAVELYAEVFEEAGALDKLEAFTSFNGPDFDHLPRNTETIELHKAPWNVPETLSFGKNKVVPIKAGEAINWKVI